MFVVHRRREKKETNKGDRLDGGEKISLKDNTIRGGEHTGSEEGEKSTICDVLYSRGMSFYNQHEEGE